MKRLKEFRLLKNMMQGEMANFLGIGGAAYSSIEVGKSQLQHKHLEKLVVEMNLNPLWLITGRGEPELSPETEVETSLTQIQKDLAAMKEDLRLQMERAQQLQDEAERSLAAHRKGKEE